MLSEVAVFLTAVTTRFLFSACLNMGNFALLVTSNPTAADIFKKTQLSGAGSFEVGAIRTVKKPSWTACQGRIVCIGKSVTSPSFYCYSVIQSFNWVINFLGTEKFLKTVQVSEATGEIKLVIIISFYV